MYQISLYTNYIIYTKNLNGKALTLNKLKHFLKFLMALVDPVGRGGGGGASCFFLEDPGSAI